MVQLVPAHGPARSTQSSPSPAGDNQGLHWTWLEVLLSPPPTSHTSSIIPRDFLQCLCDFKWPLGVHSHSLRNTLIAGTFPEVPVPLISHHIPALPRKLHPAESPWKHPCLAGQNDRHQIFFQCPTPNFPATKTHSSLQLLLTHTQIFPRLPSPPHLLALAPGTWLQLSALCICFCPAVFATCSSAGRLNGPGWYFK